MQTRRSNKSKLAQQRMNKEAKQKLLGERGDTGDLSDTGDTGGGRVSVGVVSAHRLTRASNNKLKSTNGMAKKTGGKLKSCGASREGGGKARRPCSMTRGVIGVNDTGKANSLTRDSNKVLMDMKDMATKTD